MAYTTAQCKQFLDENLNLTNTDWKRVSKKKDEFGITVRRFECVKSNISIEVLEMEAGLLLGVETVLNPNITPSPASTVQASPTSISTLPTSSAPTSTAEKEVLKEKIAQTKSASAQNPIDEVKVQNSYVHMKAVFSDCDWNDITEGGVEYTSPSGQKDHYYPYTDANFWIILNDALDTYKNLNKKEKLRFVQLADIGKTDFLTDFAQKVTIFVNHLEDLDETYAPYHMCQHFANNANMEMGFIDLLNLIKAVSSSMVDAGLPITQDQKDNVDQAQGALMRKHKDAKQYIDKSEAYQVQNSKAIAFNWGNFTLEEFIVNYEKNKISKATPSSNSSGASANKL